MCTNRFYLAVIGIGAATLIAIILGVTLICTYENVKAFENGYEQGTVLGRQGTVWIKKGVVNK